MSDCLFLRKPEDAMKTNLVPITEFLGWMMIPLLVATVSGAAENGGGAKQAPQPATATFAGGCFWCMESPFDKRDGVLSVTVGYTGGQKKNPLQYKYYRHSCGRDRRLQQLWGKEAGGH